MGLTDRYPRWHVCHHCRGVKCEACEEQGGWFETAAERRDRLKMWRAARRMTDELLIQARERYGFLANHYGLGITYADSATIGVEPRLGRAVSRPFLISTLVLEHVRDRRWPFEEAVRFFNRNGPTP